MQNSLYIVSTPIGNLKDITIRALEILKEVDFIACEDTRVTGILLNHFEIKKELVSLNAASEMKKAQYVLKRILNGESCALVSDAGTPAVSDPGIRLISSAINKECKCYSRTGSLCIDCCPDPGRTANGFICI